MNARIRMVLNSLPNQQDRNALADFLQYCGEKALTPGAHVPEGSLQVVYERLARTNPAAAAALDGMGDYIRTPKFYPFTEPQNETTRLRSLGLSEHMQTVVDAADGLAVIHELQSPGRKTAKDQPRDWVANPPNLREHLQLAAQIEEPKVAVQKYVEDEVARAGLESGASVRQHLEAGASVIGESRGYDLEEPIEARGNSGDLRDCIETAIIDVAERQP